MATQHWKSPGLTRAVPGPSTGTVNELLQAVPGPSSWTARQRASVSAGGRERKEEAHQRPSNAHHAEFLALHLMFATIR